MFIKELPRDPTLRLKRLNLYPYRRPPGEDWDRKTFPDWQPRILRGLRIETLRFNLDMPFLSLCLFTCDWSCRWVKQLLSDLSFNLRVIASIAITLWPPTSHAWKSPLRAVLLVRLTGTTSSAYDRRILCCLFQNTNVPSLLFVQTDLLLRRFSFNSNSGAVFSNGKLSDQKHKTRDD